MINDPVFEKTYNPTVLKEIKAQFGPFEEHHIAITGATEIMLRMVQKMAAKPRRGEVVMVIPNPAGDIWLHTKAFYPGGVYRLMTGGLEGDEKPHVALLREVVEETGFKIKIDRCLAVITYNISGLGRTMPFVSYVFLTTPAHGRPVPTDPNEAITDFKAVPAAILADTALQLRALDGEFADWGLFRAVAHEVAWEQLNNK